MKRIDPDLAWYQTQFRANRREAAAICEGLSGEQFNYRPGPKRWSIAECLSHLNVSAHEYIPNVKAAIERGRATGYLAQGPQRQGWLVRRMIRAMEPPPRRRYKSPARFVGRAEAFDMEVLLNEFTAVGLQWEECLDAANGLHLSRVKVRSPVVGLLRIPLGGLFAGMAAHERRHLWQAKQVKLSQVSVDARESQ
ncbi:MAG: DinB family protein [Gemmatimonadota bacterium]|nr:MAG: DinB family protein [Gemmatimonadota bacterium]